MSNCYWLQADLLCDAIVQLKHLQELDVKGTKVSFSHLVRVLGTCQKITKLGFSVLEKKWEEIQTVVGTKVNMDTITEGFKKLTSLNISTSFLDARDYLNDPWLVLIQILGSVFIHHASSYYYIELFAFLPYCLIFLTANAEIA